MGAEIQQVMLSQYTVVLFFIFISLLCNVSKLIKIQIKIKPHYEGISFYAIWCLGHIMYFFPHGSKLLF